MGYSSSTQETTSKSKTAPLSSAGMSWDDLFTDSVLASMQDYGGYDIAQQEKTEYKDKDKANTLQGQIKGYQDRLDAINKDLEINPAKAKSSAVSGPGKGGGAAVEDSRISEKKKLESQIFKYQDKLNAIGQTTYTDYTLTKKEDPRVAAAIDKFGVDSPEVKAARDEVKAQELFKADTMADVEKDYLINLKKMSSGDFSYTPEQQQQIDSYIGPVKDLINKTADQLLTESARGGLNLRNEMDKLGKAIDQTGYDVLDALKAADIQVQKSGDTLLGVLTQVNQSANAKANFEFGLLSEQIDQQSARQAAMLGLPPGSMAEKNQALAMKANALKSVELGLAEDYQNKALGIVANTEAGKQQISLARVQLAETQGGKKENLAGMGFDLENALTGQRQSIIGNQANAMIQLEQQRQSQLMNASVGNLGQMIQAGQSGLGFSMGLNQQGAAMQQGLLAPVSHALDTEQQRSFAEATNKSKTTSTPSIMDTIGAGIGLASSAAGTVMGGMSGMGVASAAKASATGGTPWSVGGGSGGSGGLFNLGLDYSGLGG